MRDLIGERATILSGRSLLLAMSFAATVLLEAGGVHADDGELAQAATNPAAPLIQLQIQDSFTPSSQGVDGWSNTGILQPVIPFTLGDDYYFQSIITRTTIPFVSTAEVAGTDGNKRKNGLGDTTILAVPAHKEDVSSGADFWQWGPLAAMQIPTATSSATGSGKWAAGAGLMVIRNLPNVWTDGDAIQLGAYGYNLWSFAETRSNSTDVNNIHFAPIAFYHFDKLFNHRGWYLGLPDELWKYDWEKQELVTAPAGLRLGKVFTIGDQSVNVFGQSWWNAASSDGAADWNAKLNLTLLFPK